MDQNTRFQSPECETRQHLSSVTRKGASDGRWLAFLLPLSTCWSFFSDEQCFPPAIMLGLLGLQMGLVGLQSYIGFLQKYTVSSSLFVRIMSVFLLQPNMPVFIAIPAMIAWGQISFVCSVACSFICQWLMVVLRHHIITAYGTSFTVGEAVLASQAAALTITWSLVTVFSRVMNRMMYISRSVEVSIFIETAFLTVVLVIVALSKCQWLRPLRLLVPLTCVVGVFGICVSSLLLRSWLPMWLFALLMRKPFRVALLTWWISLTCAAIRSTIWAQRTNRVATTVLRKVYHALIVLTFTPGIVFDPQLTLVASSAAMMFLLLLETIRVLDIPPLSGALSSSFSVFLDEKDSGVLILSHLWLLAGIGAPLWLHPCTLDEVPQPGCVLPLLAGVLSVGVGDTAASVGGTFWGHNRWPGTQKTVEGSMASVAAQLLFVYILTAFGWVEMSHWDWNRLTLSAIGVSTLEALTDQVDNIVLPLAMLLGLTLS